MSKGKKIQGCMRKRDRGNKKRNKKWLRKRGKESESSEKDGNSCGQLR